LAGSGKDTKEDAGGKDDKICRKLGLTSSEIVIKEYSCTYASKVATKGELYVLQKMIGFYGKVFGLETKEVIPISSISKIYKDETKNIKDKIIIETKNKQFIFKIRDQRDDAFTLIYSLTAKAAENTRTRASIRQDDATAPIGDEPKKSEDPMSAEDWDFLLKGSKAVKYAKDEIIIAEGAQYQRLYQLSKGVCRVEKGQKKLGMMSTGEMFGEISFLEGSGAAVTVRSEDDGVELQIIEGYYINILFDMKPGFAGRFYHHLCTVLAARLRQNA